MAIGFVRLGVGLSGLAYYLSQYGDRRYYWGPDGIIDWALFNGDLSAAGAFSVYAISRSIVWFEVIFHLGILSALCVTLGIGGRGAILLHWIFLWSLYQRNTLLLDGGDNLAYVVLPWLALAYSSHNISVRHALSRRNTLRGGWGSILMHNIAVLGIAIQICLVYVTSGLYKAQGKMWQDGTALYYILRVPEFLWPGVSEQIFTNEILVPLMTYAATFLLIFFTPLMLIPGLRLPATLAMISFHVSIGLLMGLTGFALTMLSCDMIFLNREMKMIRYLICYANRRKTRLPDAPEQNGSSLLVDSK